jgi:hypothetical protein
MTMQVERQIPFSLQDARPRPLGFVPRFTEFLMPLLDEPLRPVVDGVAQPGKEELREEPSKGRGIATTTSGAFRLPKTNLIKESIDYLIALKKLN